MVDASTEPLENYDPIMKELETVGEGNPKGRLYHVACAKGDGYFVVDVWESEELLEKFSETLVPAILNAGGNPIKPKIYPLLNIITS